MHRDEQYAPMSWSAYRHANERANQRLRRLAFRLDDRKLAMPINEWSIAVTLAHMAYWDIRALGAIAAWRDYGVRLELWSPEEHVVNQFRLPFWQSMVPSEILDQALRAAVSIDALIADLTTPEAIAVALQNRRVIVRADHRNEHLDLIERCLEQAGDA